MWRAFLADGRVVDHDGDNSPQEFLHEIVKFQVFAPNGAKIAEVDPGPRDLLVWRFVRENTGAVQRTVGCKVGVLNRDTMEADVREFNGRDWVLTDVVLTGAEVG